MTTTVFKYRVFCPEEGDFNIIWSESEPDKCKNGHSVDPNQTTIIDEVSSELIKIKEEETPTGGHYRVASIILTAGPLSTTIINHSFPYPIGVISAKLMTNESNIGDNLTVSVAPDTTIGAIIAPVSPGDRLIHVSPTVIQYIEIGFRVKLVDFTNASDLGDVISIDKTNYTITTDLGATHGFSPLSPTFVKMTVIFADKLTFGGGGLYSFGESKIGATHVPAGTICQFHYYNSSPTESNSIHPILEFLY